MAKEFQRADFKLPLTKNKFIGLLIALNVLVLVLIYRSSYQEMPICPPSNNKQVAYKSPRLDEEYLLAHPDDIVNVKHHYGYRINIHRDEWYTPWWTDKLHDWEPTTFLYFNTFIRDTTSYTGMGEWIGPTLLFAAKKAYKLVGAEPDPFAFFNLRRNVDANPTIADKITLSKLCISNKAETITMYGAGGSGSFLSKADNVVQHKEYQEKYPTNSWQVHCLPLWAFIEDHGSLAPDMFIKLDTEGAEQFIIPSLYPWLYNFTLTTGYSNKPAFFISFHDADKFVTTAMDEIVKVIHLYKWVSVVSSKIVFINAKKFSRELLEKDPWADIYLTDRSPSDYGL